MTEIVFAWLLLLAVRKRQKLRSGIDRWERGRRRSRAEMTAGRHRPMSTVDVRWAAEAEQAAEVWRTDEQPLVSVRRRHTYRPPTPRQLARMRARQTAPARAFAADPLTAPLAGPLAPSAVIPSMPHVEPAPFVSEGPTGVFDRQWIARILEESR
jgi:hypothetical protein